MSKHVRLKYGSNVPFARACIILAINECVMDRKARQYLLKALRWMHRRKAVRRAPATPQHITAQQKHRTRALINSELTYHEIANEVGIANSGRISEIMNGLR
jgi:hypothetical protein